MDELKEVHVFVQFLSCERVSKPLTDGIEFLFRYRYTIESYEKIEEEKEYSVWSGADPIVNWGFNPFELNSGNNNDKEAELMEVFKRVAALGIIDSKGGESCSRIPKGSNLSDFDKIPTGNSVEQLDEQTYKYTYFE